MAPILKLTRAETESMPSSAQSVASSPKPVLPSSKRPLRVSILGASGSIGKQALEIAREHPDKVEIVGLSVHTDTNFLVKATKEFRPLYVCVSDETQIKDGHLEELIISGSLYSRSSKHSAGEGNCKKGDQNRAKILPREDYFEVPYAYKPELLAGPKGLEEMARLPEADCVLIAVVGAAGIKATHAAIVSGKRIALANKESLVAAGDLLTPLASPGQIIPVDSEHSAIFQCLMGEDNPQDTLDRIWLTCSGGPFYGYTKEQLEKISAKDALCHPSWSMGPKITIDSATLANKGLEVIEAHHLFNVPYDKIKVLVQPSSTIHSMISFIDGSTKAQLAAPSMKTPILLAFSYPDRWPLADSFVNYQTHEPLSFGKPDPSLFRCLPLAVEAGKAGGIMPAVMNAANEVANTAFREGRIGFLDIPIIIEKTLEQTKNVALADIEELLEVDQRARALAQTFI